ncbi:hypothetical protein RDV64_23515 (plasmid) [Acuticoccus sp. MNP-M23]|uniref:hypothetical protein n=1 Tax=Acuticoccus sp. MNP-M23 TaxID=3072793 RepID=UPI002814E503|nr:hypothetical protein [Acuticoccus sp. MNP-M23]WMS45345.1 hypothetical protein RDV64_23515 [Acuticoccus sp. MNP-M23]
MAQDPKSFFGRDPDVTTRPSHAERVAPQRSDGARPQADTPIEHKIGSTDYKAYGVLTGGSSDCDVRKWKELRMDLPEGVMFDYRLLSMVSYSALDLDGIEQEIDLMFPDCIIRLIGRHLDDLRLKIRRRQVSFIQEYSPMVYKTPVDRLPDDEPVITKIYVMQGGDQMRAASANQRPI